MNTLETDRTGGARRITQRGRRVGAVLTTLALGAGFALASPAVASAEESAESYAEGQFLSGVLLGIDLDDIAEIQSAEARNDGTQPTQTSKDPLNATVLNTVTVAAEPAPQIDLGGVLQLGPISQYAQANSDGTSLGASGAVSDDGAIGVGADSSAPPTSATLDLSALLGDEFASTLLDLKLELEAIAAQAQGDLEAASGDYALAGAKLQFSSPAIANLTKKVDSALVVVQNELDRLVASNGPLVVELNQLLQSLDPTLNLLGANANVRISIDTGDLTSIVHRILTDQFGDSGVAFNLETGLVTVDLEALLGGSLNDLPVGTELLTDVVIDQILTGITTTVATIADQVVDIVEDALHDATVSIHADLSLNVAQAPLVDEVCKTLSEDILEPVLGDAPLTAVLEALGLGKVGSLVDNITDKVGDLVYDENGNVKKIVGFVTRTVETVVCDTVVTAVEPLTTSVVLDIRATVDQLLSGVAAQATANAKVLGIPVNVNLNLVLDDLGAVLTDALFDGDGAITELVEALQNGLVRPAETALLGTDANAIGIALSDLVSIKVNLQETRAAETGGGMAATAAIGSIFTQTAVRVSVLPSLGGASVATVNLAQASVGPNVTTIVDDPGDPDGPGDPGCTVNCGNGGTPTSTGSLAMTGVGIGTLVAVILALLAAGAYLVWESHRRSRATGTEAV